MTTGHAGTADLVQLMQGSLGDSVSVDSGAVFLGIVEMAEKVEGVFGMVILEIAEIVECRGYGSKSGSGIDAA